MKYEEVVGTQSSSGVPRRVVAAGAAWAVPAFTVAAAAPALASSDVLPVCTVGACPDLTLTSAPQWQQPSLGTDAWGSTSSAIVAGTGTTGFNPSWTPEQGNNFCTGVAGGPLAGSASNVVVGEGDPAADGGYLVYGMLVCMPANTTLTANYSWLSYNTNARGATMQMWVEPYSSGQQLLPTGGAKVGPEITAPPMTPNAAGTVTGGVPYVTTVLGLYVIKIVWTFDSTPAFGGTQICEYGTNDIGMHSLTMACT